MPRILWAAMDKFLKQAELAAFFRVSTNTIRHWEKDGKVRFAHRTPTGRKRYLNPEWKEPVEA